MRIEPLALHHKSLIENALKSLAIPLSEYCFGNLFLFRKKHEYEVIQGQALYIRGKAYDGASFIMPLELPDIEILQNYLHDVDCIYPIPEKWLSLFDVKWFQHTYKEADSDYIYEVEKLATYHGLSKKRNLEKQFLAEYESRSEALIAANKHDAEAVLSNWQKEGESDVEECLEALSLLEALDLIGIIVYVRDKPVAFMLGEANYADQFVVHFAKADIGYKGIYQHLYHLFAARLQGRYSFLNLEQDLGNPQIAHSKHSYHPMALAKKWRIISTCAAAL